MNHAPDIMEASAIQPFHDIVAVSTNPFPIEQPPATDVPKPMQNPPIMLLRIGFSCSNLPLHSCQSEHSLQERAKTPKLKKTPDAKGVRSPVTKVLTKFAERVVMPIPCALPGESLTGHAKSAMRETAIAATKG